MHYSSFSELPQFLKDYIRDFMGDSAEKWAEKPMPALHGHTFIDLVNEKGVRAASEFALNVATKFAVSYALEIPPEYE